MDNRTGGRLQAPAEASTKIIKLLIEAEGLSRLLMLLQTACERIAAELTLQQNGAKNHEAAKYLRAAETIAGPHMIIKDELKL